MSIIALVTILSLDVWISVDMRMLCGCKGVSVEDESG